MSRGSLKDVQRLAVGDLPRRFAQALGRHPFEVAVRMAPTKRRLVLLRQEALRQAELSRLMREKLIAHGELWEPTPGTRLARDWDDVRRQLVQAGEIPDV